jgi:hypothetical protein
MAAIESANSWLWMRSARPPPYSSAWISTIAAFGGPDMRGMAQVWGSASFSW